MPCASCAERRRGVSADELRERAQRAVRAQRARACPARWAVGTADPASLFGSILPLALVKFVIYVAHVTYQVRAMLIGSIPPLACCSWMRKRPAIRWGFDPIRELPVSFR